MAFMNLPNELLRIIIIHSLPEGFESLALACKHIYALCSPFINSHNRLRQDFQQFSYSAPTREPRNRGNLTFSEEFSSAFNLIARIANEPVVPRYISEANFRADSRVMRRTETPFVEDESRDDTVARLFSDSFYLRETGINWTEYYAAIEDDLRAPRYSQHAAALVLTLLPNLRVLKLPGKWTSAPASDKLVDAVIHRARKAYLPDDQPSLSQVTELELVASLGAHTGFNLDWVTPFLALPRLRSFVVHNCVATGDRQGIAAKYPHGDFKSALEVAHLVGASADEVAIADFLRHTPHLKKFIYSHATREDGPPQDWDLCHFVTTIEREVGSHLVELSVFIGELRGSIPPGKASLRGFQRLQRLELPLEIVACNLEAASPEDQSYISESLISDLVPPSVSHLSLISYGVDYYDKVLDILFRDFSIKKHSQVPALRKVQLACRTDYENKSFEELFARLGAELEKVGVILQLELHTRDDP